MNGVCKKCGANQIYDEKKGRCKCSGSSFKADDGSCVICPPNMAYFNSKCQCLFNYFEISPGGWQKCRKDTDGPKCRKNK